MGRAAWVGCLGLVLTFAVGCPPPKADDRPARTDFDGGGRTSVVTLRGGTGGVGGTDGGGPATGGEPAEWPTTTLSASVQQVTLFNSDSPPGTFFVNAGAYNGQVDVWAEGRAAKTPVVSPAREADFDLADVRKAEDVWVRLTTDDPTVMGALFQVDTTDSGEDALYVVQRALIEEIIRRSQDGITLNRDRSQIVVRVIDSDRQGVAEVTVTQGTSIVLYKQLNVWDGSATQTDSSGLAFIANVLATAADDSTATFTLNAERVTVPVYPDTVTLVEVTYP